MWVKSYSKVYPGIKKTDVWRMWADVIHWPTWDKELEYCKIEGGFIKGNSFILKSVGGPKVKITLSEVITNERFTDYCKFFGATMHDDHILEETSDGLRIISTITVTGPLSFIWAKLVAKKVANSVPNQMDALVDAARLKND